MDINTIISTKAKMTLMKLIQNYDYENWRHQWRSSPQVAEDAAPDYGTKLYYKSEGLDFEKAIANINELYETHVTNLVNDEINFVRKKYYDANVNI